MRTHSSARRATRTLLAGLAVVGLLAACGGDDDDPKDDPSSTEEGTDEGADDPTTDEGTTDDGATDEGTGAEGTDGGEDTAEEAAVDICGLLDTEAINAATGESFDTTDRYEDESCRLSNADGSGYVQLSLHLLDDGETEAGFISDGEEACDAGTIRDDVDLSFADGGGFACYVEGEAAVAAGHEGAVALLVAHPSSEVPDDQLFAAMAGILADIVSV